MAQYTASVFWLWLLPDSEKYFENYKNSIIPDVGHAEVCVFAWIVFYYFTICHLFNLLNPWPCLCIQEGSCQLKLVIFTCFLSWRHETEVNPLNADLGLVTGLVTVIYNNDNTDIHTAALRNWFLSVSLFFEMTPSSFNSKKVFPRGTINSSSFIFSRFNPVWHDSVIFLVLSFCI